ncbi:VirK/YbjX family protein [Pasteurella bettyae]|uniref:PF04393 family protein n=1 Tax=Pasteurella bettyae CCUG 2042 TaxID=1095749 RepID=I3DBI6_9PAST|nr:DUF535 family protein [Pasteurella bettyae]EIJ69079.1 PF04393 family protein [Pasteurella bettyae CCUG 2042]SUB22975.1 membrane protein [Pasteurella bettyae]
MTVKYSWPKPMAIYPDRGKKSYRLKRLRYRLRSILHLGKIKQFTDFVNKHDELIPLLNARPNYSYPLVHRFLDKRFGASQRFSAICDNLLFLSQRLTTLKLPQLWEQPIGFGEVIDGFEIILNINEHQPMEGFWALELRQKDTQQLIYLLTFGQIKDALLIAVIQGPNFEGSKEIVKLLTKQCHGLRPAYLMVEAMKGLTQVLGYKRLLGIPQKYQNKSRLVNSKRYVVDYDAIFSESDGVLQEYWELPLAFETKDISEITSKKRSMYRKRYAMLEELKANMAKQLS